MKARETRARGPYGPYTPEETRRDLLAASLELFGRNGFDGTSVNQIVEKAGVTKGAFYHHFQSKEDVLQKIHHEYASQMVAGAREVAASDAEPIEKLRSIITRAVIAFGRYRSYVAVFYQEFRVLSKSTFGEVRTLHDEEENILLGIIEDARAAGQLRPATDAKLLVFAISGVSAWLYQWYDQRGPMTIEEIADGLADIILTGVVP
jgi:AcrR family transcriptional regulator